MANQLRRDGKGYYYRNLGYQGRATGKPSQPKFILGKDRVFAEERLRRVELMWSQLASDAVTNGSKPLWTDVALDVAKAIARGEASYEVPYEEGIEPVAYAALVQAIAGSWPVITFIPENATAYFLGLKMAEAKGQSLQSEAEQVQADAEAVYREASAYLDVSGTAALPLKPLGGNLHKAMESYIQWIEKEYFDSSEGHVSDNGKTKIRQVRTLMHHLPEMSLAKLDFEQCNEAFGILRRRPKSRHYSRPMTYKSCSNYIGELKRFFEWLDTTTEYEWELPPKFDRIKRTPMELESDIEAAAAEVPVYSMDQLITLYRYATPIERVFVLLALNCAYGADQIGRLRISEIDFGDDDTPAYLGHLRRKKKVRGSHRLWKHTVVMLRWMLARDDLRTPRDNVAVHRNGTPYYRKSNGGNRQNDIAKAWYRLLDRVRADYLDFPRHGFNTLRDTSTNMVRQLAGDELASLHCSHKHQSADKNLAQYSNPRREALYHVHVEMEELLSEMFATVSDPSDVNPQAYTSLGKITKIKSLHEDGIPATQIAKAIGVHRMTVYRHLDETSG